MILNNVFDLGGSTNVSPAMDIQGIPGMQPGPSNLPSGTSLTQVTSSGGLPGSLSSAISTMNQSYLPISPAPGWLFYLFVYCYNAFRLLFRELSNVR